MDFKTVDDNRRTWILQGDRPVAAIQDTGIRSYIFPFLTPRGTNVLQACPPDHPHHQGIWVAQDLVNGHNFWLMGNPGQPRNTQKLRSTTAESGAGQIRITQQLTWITEGGQSMLDEERVTRFAVREGFHLAEVRSTWTAAYGDLYIGRTKEGGIALRVHYGLETFWGGCLRNSLGDVGEADVFDKEAEWIQISGRVEGNQVGVVMMPHPAQEHIPWFARDYGVHVHGPCRHAPRRIEAGQGWSLCAGFAAFDGPADGTQAARAWERYNELQ